MALQGPAEGQAASKRNYQTLEDWKEIHHLEHTTGGQPWGLSLEVDSFKTKWWLQGVFENSEIVNSLDKVFGTTTDSNQLGPGRNSGKDPWQWPLFPS